MANDEEIAAIFKRFGDEQSTLLDQYERRSFEVHLNKAMLGRSLSEAPAPRLLPPPKHGRNRKAAGFQKVMRKLFSPILGKKAASTKEQQHEFHQSKQNPLLFSKNFSRSLRV